jgi:uncharacterized protein YcfL
MKSPQRLLVLSVLAAGALAALSGCATNVNTVERAQPQATPDFVADKRVITDDSLARTVRVIAINQATVSGNLLKIQATLENLKNSPRTIRYKFEWIDQSGMAVNSPTETWKTLMLQGRETTMISTVAITPRAVDFVLKLSEHKE